MNRQEFIEYVVRAQLDAGYPYSVEDMAKDAAAAWEVMHPTGARVSRDCGSAFGSEIFRPGSWHHVPSVDYGIIANIATEVELSLKPVSLAAGYRLDVTLRYRNGKRATMSTSMQMLEEDRKVTLAVPHV